ncbi:MAG TPA: FkbM family methyltransferase [Tepidisphaeraceae bacterium]
MFSKPEYASRPAAVLQRIGVMLRRGDPQSVVRRLPWGLELAVRPCDTVGAAIDRCGVYDLGVTEVLWRLIDQGEHCCDAGANIGYMTSVMAFRAGEVGNVLAFEPHPDIFAELLANHARWAASGIGVANVSLHNSALSDINSRAWLSMDVEFAANRGTAHLAAEPTKHGNGFEVETTRLDFILGESARLDVLKIDVEGHELNVLKGCERIFRSRRPRDIVFEEHNSYPTPVTDFLEENGYAIYAIRRTNGGPTLLPPREGAAPHSFDPVNLLATRDFDRASQRILPRGWQCLRGQVRTKLSARRP